MKICVEREKCISANSCVAILPEVFELDEEGIAIIKKETQKADGSTKIDKVKITKETILDSARSCPTDAVIVEDDNGKQIHP